MRQQQGISAIGLLFVGAVLAYIGIVSAQVFPTVVEWQNIQKAVVKAAAEPTANEVRVRFDKAAQIDDITSIRGKDLRIEKEGDKMIVSFAYNREIHLAGPAYLLLKYAGQSQ